MKRLIFRAWIMRNGKKDYAKNHGLRAWPILIDEDEAMPDSDCESE